MNLNQLRKKINLNYKKENKDISKVLNWMKKRMRQDKTQVKKVSIKDLKDWSVHSNGNIFHKSKQFFSLQGVKVSNAYDREVKNWEQPLLFQRHGGILAIMVREKNGVVEFLLKARREPGDGKGELKLGPSFSATQSNINLAHGGKKTELSELILKSNNIIGKTLHYEEGARFWKKPNRNYLVFLEKKNYHKIKNKNFIWLNITQIKKLNLINGIINPFVKTILFMI
jgi:dTDP-4-dehydro-6-deoxy-alpha-D-glucopyranose 2,3-dehydratase